LGLYLIESTAPSRALAPIGIERQSGSPIVLMTRADGNHPPTPGVAVCHPAGGYDCYRQADFYPGDVFRPLPCLKAFFFEADALGAVFPGAAFLIVARWVAAFPEVPVPVDDCLRVLLPVAAFLGAAFFSAVFPVVAFLAAAFLTAVFLDADALGTAFLGDAFLGVAFLGGAFLGVAFLGGDFLGAAFLGAVADAVDFADEVLTERAAIPGLPVAVSVATCCLAMARRIASERDSLLAWTLTSSTTLRIALNMFDISPTPWTVRSLPCRL
jgi:hypothetical protein